MFLWVIYYDEDALTLCGEVGASNQIRNPKIKLSFLFNNKITSFGISFFFPPSKSNSLELIFSFAGEKSKQIDNLSV